MKEESKLIYNTIKPYIKSTARGFLGLFRLPNTFRRYCDEDYENNFVDQFFMVYDLACATALSTFFPAVSIVNLAQGDIKKGLLWSIPIITNSIDGLHELYKWAKEVKYNKKHSNKRESGLEKDLCNF